MLEPSIGRSNVGGGVKTEAVDWCFPALIHIESVS